MQAVCVERGNFNQGQIISNYAGFQCTAIVFYALLFSSFSNDPANWSASEINNIMTNGHGFYQQIMASTGDLTPRYLGHWELPHQVQYLDINVQVQTYNEMLFGVVGIDQTQGNVSVGSVDIRHAIVTAFSISDHVIATLGSTTIGLLHSSATDRWFVFDSHSINSSGVPVPDGTASSLVFTSIDAIVSFLQLNYHHQMFEISPVIFEGFGDEGSIQNQ